MDLYFLIGQEDRLVDNMLVVLYNYKVLRLGYQYDL